ncbi:MAG TPA: CBS domain-containing protein [Candidatus Dormibacteraeota bacterium]
MTDLSLLDPAREAPDAIDPVVADVMRDEVVFCLPSTPVDAIAKLMADNLLTEVPVLIDRRPVGYVASGDIVEQFVEGRVQVAGSDVVRPQPTDVLARDVLRHPPLLADEGARLGEVVATMRAQGRTMALVMHEDTHPVGMLTVWEIANHAAAQLRRGGAADG